MTADTRIKLNPTQTKVLGIILEARGPVWLKDISAQVDRTDATVSRVLDVLRRAKLIEVTSRPSPTGMGRRCYATAVQYFEPEPRQPLADDWPSKVSPLQRDVYAAILELAPEATYKALTDYLQVKRGTVNVACSRLEALGVITLRSVKYAGPGRRRMTAYPVVGLGAEAQFREYRRQHMRPAWMRGLPPAADVVYRILQAYGPMTRRQITEHPYWTNEHAQLSKSLVWLAEAGAIDYSTTTGPTGRQCRLYRAKKGKIGAPPTPQPITERKETWASKPYTPPTRGRARYRGIGRGKE